ARTLVAIEMLKSVDDLSDKQAAAKEVITALNNEIPNYQRTQTTVALEAIFLRDDIRAAAGLEPIPGEITAASIWAQDIRLASLMEEFPASKHHRALESFKAAN